MTAALVKPAVVWFTGLPGSGKTTLARLLVERARAEGRAAEQLDGDRIRELFPGTGFTREEREIHVRRVGRMACSLREEGVFVAVSLISPYAASRRYARELCADFIEVYLSTSLEECERRDPKGLYARARRGEIKDFTGIDGPYEPPESPELVIDTERVSVEQALAEIAGAAARRRGGGA